MESIEPITLFFLFFFLHLTQDIAAEVKLLCNPLLTLKKYMTVLLSCLSLAFGVGKKKKSHKTYISLHV